MGLKAAQFVGCFHRKKTFSQFEAICTVTSVALAGFLMVFNAAGGFQSRLFQKGGFQ